MSTPARDEVGRPQTPLQRPQTPRERTAPPGGVMLPRTAPPVRRPPLTVWLDVLEVANHLRVSKMTIYRRIHSGELKATRVGRSLRIKESDLREFIEYYSTQDAE